MRWLFWILGGVLLGGVVHIVTVLALPMTATKDAYTRLSALAPIDSVTVLPQPTPKKSVLPYMDPAFATSICRFNLVPGPMALSIAVNQSYTSVSFYTQAGIAFYAINDRAAGRRVIKLNLMTADQKDALPENEDITAADRLIVVSPTESGLILFRALASEPNLITAAEKTVAAAHCLSQPQP